MMTRIAAIAFVFLCSSIGWIILGATLLARTNSASDALSGQVQSIWGAPQVQSPPSASYNFTVTKVAAVEREGKTVLGTTEEVKSAAIPVSGSQIDLDLGLDYRQKGLLWYSTYAAGFSGNYTFHNPTNAAQLVRFNFPLPAKQAIYDDVVMSVDGKPLELATSNGAIAGNAVIEAKKDAILHVGYRSQGLDSWQYKLSEDISEVKNFRLKVTTNFGGFNFLENTLSPGNETKTGNGWELNWSYRDLVSGFQIGIEMPQKLQPGPLAGRISFFAPVSLLFFFFVIFILTMLRGIEFHPMNYFFLACAFFAFHLLLAYLVDRVSIHWSFLICSAVSMFLVWSYLRVTVGRRFALEAILAQFAYLVLFSYAFFFQGFTGLTITIGAILTLFIAMQATAKIRWSERFARKPA